MTTRITLGSLLLLLLAPLVPVSGMAYAQSTMTLGATGSTDRGAVGTIPLLGYHHEVTAPRDAASGMATGKRQHKPFTVVKEVDKSSPILYNALITGETIPSLEFGFARQGARTGEYLKIRLEQAKVAGISASSGAGSGSGGSVPMEEISFSYAKITWTWTDGTSATDDWSAARVGADALPADGVRRR